MWPWGHAAVGYFVVLGVTFLRRRRLLTRAEILVVLFATQLPDIIDKPLSLTVNVLPTGRSLAHSLLTATVLVALALWLATRYERPTLATAFGLGYVSHLFADLPLSVVGGDLSPATFLLWPVLPSHAYASEPSIIAHFTAIELTSSFLLQALVAVLIGSFMLLNFSRRPRTLK